MPNASLRVFTHRSELHTQTLDAAMAVASGEAVPAAAVYESQEFEPERQVIHSTCNDLVEALRRSGAFIPTLRVLATARLLTFDACIGTGLDITSAPDAPIVHVAHARQLATEGFPKWDEQLPPGRVRQEERRAIRDLLLLKVHMIDAHAQRTIVRACVHCVTTRACVAMARRSARDLTRSCRRAQVRLRAAAAAVVVARGQMPSKLNPVVQSTMNSVKLEPDEAVQGDAAAVLSAFVVICADNGRAVVAEKVVTNLCRFVAASVTSPDGEAAMDLFDPEPIRTRGAKAALAAIVQWLGARLWETLPGLLALVTQPLCDAACGLAAAADTSATDATVTGEHHGGAEGTAQSADTSLQSATCGAALVCALAPHVDASQRRQLVDACPTLLQCLLPTPHGAWACIARPASLPRCSSSD